MELPVFVFVYDSAFCHPQRGLGCAEALRVFRMATRETYGQTFDEDVSSDRSATCAECVGQIRTNSMETACEDSGLIIDELRIDHGPAWRNSTDHSD